MPSSRYAGENLRNPQAVAEQAAETLRDGILYNEHEAGGIGLFEQAWRRGPMRHRDTLAARIWPDESPALGLGGVMKMGAFAGVVWRPECRTR
jgi:hypothetical protein